MKKAIRPQRYPPTKTRLFLTEGTCVYYDRAPVRDGTALTPQHPARTLSSMLQILRPFTDTCERCSGRSRQSCSSPHGLLAVHLQMVDRRRCAWSSQAILYVGVQIIPARPGYHAWLYTGEPFHWNRANTVWLFIAEPPMRHMRNRSNQSSATVQIDANLIERQHQACGA